MNVEIIICDSYLASDVIRRRRLWVTRWRYIVIRIGRATLFASAGNS